MTHSRSDPVLPLQDQQVFHWERVPLQGINLIEASAGTGKTYALTLLYLRLVLEQEISVDRILVLTFTNAAAEELRRRLRAALSEARAILAGGAGGNNPALTSLCAGLREHGQEQQALRQLNVAVESFDEAAVYTIHGFCHRVLTEHAFECGVPFGDRLDPNAGKGMLRQLRQDYWRRHLCTADPWFADFVSRILNQQPDRLLAEQNPFLYRHCLRVVPEQQRLTLAAGVTRAEQQLRQSYARTAASWRRHGEPLRKLLSEATALDRRKYPAASWPVLFAALDGYLRERACPGLPDTGQQKALHKCRRDILQQAVKKGRPAPEHPFFGHCVHLHRAGEQLTGQYRRLWWSMQREFLQLLPAELQRYQQRQRLMTYDDLLQRVHQVLLSSAGERLSRNLRQRYPVALIDEFQDTDPVQYRVFRHLYQDQEGPVFLVGDPKQAIYGFRGADVFVYLKGREEARHTHVLRQNWRSVPRLIDAVNAIFQRAPQPFALERIGFVPSVPGAATEQERRTLIDPEQSASCVLWWQETKEDASLNIGQGEELAATATVSEISRLLHLGQQGKALIGEQPIQGRDIAILVRTHRQGLQLRLALQRVGIPSVLHSIGSVLDGEMAGELECVLRALLRPEAQGRLRAALTTRLLGMSANELAALEAEQWGEQAGRFYAWRAQWQRHGFMTMFRALLHESGAQLRLLALPGGERLYTDLLHLAELLQREAQRRRSGMESSIHWFCGQLHDPGRLSQEEQRLRLESDENLVQIVTIHVSKGLEYPVVFCPFLWKRQDSKPRKNEVYCHDPDNGDEPVLCLADAAPEALQRQASLEAFAEELRLAYVALTRARSRCYLYWGFIRKAGVSPLAWLLHGSQRRREWNLEQWQEHFKTLSASALRSDLEELQVACQGAVAVCAPPATQRRLSLPAVQEALERRHFQAQIHAPQRISSFSALIAGHSPELPDYDAATEPREAGAPLPDSAMDALPDADTDVHAFPRGAQPGQCLHVLLERLNFQLCTRAEVEMITARALDEYGINARRWTGTVAAMVERVLDTPLDAAGALRLRTLSSSSRLNELEFYYRAEEFSARELRALLQDHAADLKGVDPGRLSFETVQGYMKGYIDLVFEHEGRYYLADYKSTWLGTRFSAYTAAHLNEVMMRESYFLQYLIYALALHRYLQYRLPDYRPGRHFGGVFYLFLRGMNRAPGSGVFYVRPSAALLDRFSASLRRGEPG